MKLTEEFIRDNFRKFNEEYFSSKLIEPIFEVMHIRTALGYCKWKNKKSGKKTVKYDWKICVSDYFDRSEYDYQNTIIHEMIHLHIRYNNLEDDRIHHGTVFYEIADRINKAGGWNVSRTSDIAGCGLSRKKNVVYNMIACKNKYNKSFLMRYKGYRKSYFSSLLDRNGYKDVIWFTSTDDKKYAHFPECNKIARGWFITDAEYNEIADEYKEKYKSED